MKKIFIALMLVATVFAVNAQQPKNVVHDPNAQVRNVSGFKSISVSGGISLYLSQGSTDAVAVSIEDGKGIEKIITEVKNGTLKIYVESGAWNAWNWKNKRIKAYVTAKTIEKIEASGACSVTVTDKISSGDMKIDLSGASNFKGEVGVTSAKLEVTGASNFKGSITASGNVKLDISGASSATLSGSASKADVDVSGASSLKAFEFSVDNCKAEASGASSASINVKKELSAEASGASSIKYTGDPSVKNVETSGASSVKKTSK
jgi:hypothetical protein